MATNTTSQTKPRLGELRDRVLHDEEMVIARQAVADLRAGRARMARRRKGRPLSDRDIKDAIAAGRP